ncbi:MAG: DUF86 domain-containing protein, partial [Betaproteobacteria bacterium]
MDGLKQQVENCTHMAQKEFTPAERQNVVKYLNDQFYRGDRLLRQAIERNFEIIGEAIKRLGKHDPEIVARIGEHRQVIAFRNVLIRGYDLVDHALVWSTIEQQVPAPLRDVGALLG